MGLSSQAIPVLVPCFGRPSYLQEVIQHLEAASNISNTVVIFSQDGANPEVTRLIQTANLPHKLHLRHRQPYFGIPSWFIRTDAPTAAHVLFLLRFAFEHLQV